jgi:signal transduction histidine kinase
VFFQSVFGAVQQRRGLLDIKSENMVSLAATVAAETDGVLSHISYLFASLDLWLLAHPDKDPRLDPEFAGYVDAFLYSTSNLVDIYVASADGRLYTVPSASGDPAALVLDREYFQVQLDPATRGFHIGTTVRSRVSGRWIIPISFPLVSHNAGMTVIVAIIDMPRLLAMYDRFRPVPESAIALLRADGSLLARTPFLEEQLGRTFSVPAAAVAEARAGTGAPVVARLAGLDGEPRLIAYGTVGQTGLVAAASVTVASAVASWRRMLPILIVGSGAIILILGFIAARLSSLLDQLGLARSDLERSVRGLEEGRAARDRLYSIISHDLRGPVGGIANFLETLSREHAKMCEEDLTEGLGALVEAANNTYSLLEDLLTWTKSQGGAIPFTPKVLDVAEVLADSLASARDLAEAKGIRLASEVAPGTTIFADLSMLSTILRNLVSNAIKYSLPGGLVRLVARESRKSGKGAAQEKGTTVLVIDAGEGMDEATLAKLFDVAAVKSRPGTAGEKGTGLGLQVVKEFMERHGGRMAVASRPGAGSTFDLFFPSGPEAGRAGT